MVEDNELQTPEERLAQVDAFVEQTRAAVFVRRADSLLLVRPDKAMGLNASALDILEALYAEGAPPACVVLDRLAARLGVAAERLVADTLDLVTALGAVLREDWQPRKGLHLGGFEPGQVGFPTIGEIALTYRCNNKCTFCYAGSPTPGREPMAVMSTDEVKRVMDRMLDEAHVPSLSFTGGEATLRKDLRELIRHGALRGIRINLITNGLRAGNLDYARSLVDAGLASAQVSLEAAEAQLHDAIVARPGAFEQTVAAVSNFRQLGIHVHTNSTLCAANLHHAEALVRFVAGELSLPTLSMNMVIRTGEALRGERVGVSYTAVGERLPSIVAAAREAGIRFVWYSPIPYCIFNPVLHGLGAKSCACVSGILSVDPTGRVLPCSSFETGLGSLLHQPFDAIYDSRKARYWRKKRFVPPHCRGCEHEDICGGACPLYWDNASFSELPGAAESALGRRLWEWGRRYSGCAGVSAPGEAP